MNVSSNSKFKNNFSQQEYQTFTPRTTFQKLNLDDKEGNIKDFRSTVFGRINEVNQLMNALNFGNKMQTIQEPSIKVVPNSIAIKRKAIPKSVFEAEDKHSLLFDLNKIRTNSSFKTINYSISDLSGKIRDFKTNQFVLSNKSKIKIKAKAPSSTVLIDFSKKLLNNDPLLVNKNNNLPTISETVKNARDKLNEVLTNNEKVIEKHYMKNLNILSKKPRKFELPNVDILTPEMESLKNDQAPPKKKKKKFSSMKNLSIKPEYFKEKPKKNMARII